MNFNRIIAVCSIILTCCTINAEEQKDSTNKIQFSGEAYTEVNYGHRYYGEERKVWDFPHIVVAAELGIGGGWSFTAEFEYERIYDDGGWCNDHSINFATNKLYVNKSWNDALNVKAGIIDVPLGLTNAGRPLLTIYDPESEAALMPMTWHEAGICLHGHAGIWAWSVAALAYTGCPWRENRMLGSAASLDCYPATDLRIGIGGYWGTSKKGMIGRDACDFMGDNGVAYGVINTDYVHNGWTIDSSLIYCSDNSACSAGIEAGYDIFTLTGIDYISMIPFARYDGVFGTTEPPMNKYTLGFNFSPLDNLVLKTEYGMRHFSGISTQRTIDFSVGYTLNF